MSLNFNKVKRMLSFILLSLIVFFTACAKREHFNLFDPAFTSTEDIVIPETTKIIDNEDWEKQLISISSDSTEIYIKSSIKKKYNIRKNDILISSNGEGLLRKVTSVADLDSIVVAVTEPATLTEAVRDGARQFEFTLSDLQIKRIINYRPGVALKTNLVSKKEEDMINLVLDVILYDSDGSSSTTNDQVKIVGDFYINPTITGKFKISDWSVKKLEFGAEIKEKLNLELVATIASLNWSNEVKLADIEFHNIIVWLGNIPVIITPILEINAGADVDFDKKMTVGIKQELDYNLGVRYENKQWLNYSTLEEKFQYDEPNLYSNLTARAFIKPVLKLKVYGEISTKYYGERYELLEADNAKDPWWELYTGVKFGISVNRKIWDKALTGYEKEIIAPPPVKLADAGGY